MHFVSFHSCFTSTSTIRFIRDKEPRTFTQLLSSGVWDVDLLMCTVHSKAAGISARVPFILRHKKVTMFSEWYSSPNLEPGMSLCQGCMDKSLTIQSFASMTSSLSRPLFV